MKTQIATLQEFAGKLLEDAQAKEDYNISTNVLELQPVEGCRTVRVDNGGDSFELETLPRFHQQVSDRLGIPYRYYERCRTEAPEILTHQVNSWWRQAPETRLIRTHSGRARAYLSDRYGILDNDHIASIVLPILADVPGVEFHSLAVTEEKLYVKIVSPKFEGEVDAGDVIQLGLAVTNSEVGQGAFRIDPILYRLVCKNGLIQQEDAFRANHVGKRIAGEGVVFKRDTLRVDAEATLLKARDTVSALLTQETFGRLLKSFSESKEQKIEASPRKVVERLGKSFSLTEGEQDNVLTHLLQGGELNRFGVINAVTRASQDIESYDRAHSFEVLGGKLLNLKQTEWKQLAEAA